MKIYFHIGQAKTGTSAIQSFLNYNRELIREKFNILYPNFNSPDFTKGFMHSHAIIFSGVADGGRESCLEKFSHCISYSNKHGIKQMVISVEGFEWDWFPGLIVEISQKFKIDYSIILYLRRQDHYLEAAWKQWGHKIAAVSTVKEYAKHINLDWYRTVSKWVKYIDPQKFIVRPYEKTTIGNDVVADFLKIMGVPPSTEFNKPQDNNLNKNNGLNTDVLEILKLSHNMVKDVHNHNLLDFMYNTLPDYYKKQPMVSYNLLSPAERLDIIGQFTASNNRVAEIFLKPKSILFNDPLPNLEDKWEKYEGLTLEKTIPVFMEIMFRQHNEIRALRQALLPMKYVMNIPAERIFNKSRFNNQIRNRQLIDNAIHYESAGDDPTIVLPKIELPKSLIKIKIDITSPVKTFVQLYYKTKLFSGYHENQSVRTAVADGRQTIILTIPVFNLFGRLRLDVGSHPGKYVIHSIDIII